MSTPRPHHRRLAVLAAGALTLAVVAGACSKGSDDAQPDKATTSSTSTVPKDGKDKITPRKGVGSVSVTIGQTHWNIEVTNCVSTKERITAQGDDQKGRTVVATFDRKTKKGSVTITDGDVAWSAGPAGGTAITRVTIDGPTVRGSGTFARRTLTVSDGKATSTTAAARAPEPESGTFAVVCVEAG